MRLLVLGESMLARAPEKITNQQHVDLYIRLLVRQGKHKEAIDVLQKVLFFPLSYLPSLPYPHEPLLP